MTCSKNQGPRPLDQGVRKWLSDTCAPRPQHTVPPPHQGKFSSLSLPNKHEVLVLGFPNPEQSGAASTSAHTRLRGSYAAAYLISCRVCAASHLRRQRLPPRQCSPGRGPTTVSCTTLADPDLPAAQQECKWTWVADSWACGLVGSALQKPALPWGTSRDGTS